MKKYSITILAGLTCFLLSVAPGALAQGDGEGKPVPYNLKTVETVQGMVVAAPRPTPKGGMPERAQLTLKTEKETLTVYLGPGWFLEKQGMKMAIWTGFKSPAPESRSRDNPHSSPGKCGKGSRS